MTEIETPPAPAEVSTSDAKRLPPPRDYPYMSPLRGRDLALGLLLFFGVVAASVWGVGLEGYREFSAVFGERAQQFSWAFAGGGLLVALAAWIPWLIHRAPNWLLSLSLLVGIGASTPVLLVRLTQPDDVYLAAMVGLTLGGLLGLIYAAQIDWDMLEGGTLLGCPCALAGLLLLPGAVHAVSPSLSEWMGVGEVALGGVLGYGLGYLVGALLLDRFARGLSAALCFVPAGASLGIGGLAAAFALGF